jgi:hypothetical protein
MPLRSKRPSTDPDQQAVLQEWSPEFRVWRTKFTGSFTIDLPRVIRTDLRARIQGRVLIVEGQRRVEQVAGPPKPEPFVFCLKIPPEFYLESRRAYLKKRESNGNLSLDVTFSLRTLIKNDDGALTLTVPPLRDPASPTIFDAIRAAGGYVDYEGDPFPVDLVDPDSPSIAAREQSSEQQMAQDDGITFKQDGTLVKGGVPYRLLSAAASEVRTSPTTLARWIKNQTKFEGEPLQSFYFPPTHTYFVSEESIQRLANRFIKWRSQKPAGPAGPVILGETKDRSGYLGMSEAAHIAGVSKRTMWLWCSHGTAPTDKPLDVIKCTASDYFYIREKDAYELKKLIPRSGLQRGHRPLTLQPS